MGFDDNDTKVAGETFNFTPLPLAVTSRLQRAKISDTNKFKGLSKVIFDTDAAFDLLDAGVVATNIDDIKYVAYQKTASKSS